MNLDALQGFCAIVDEGNFRVAAESLNRTQPALSQQLASLERQLGERLYDRRRRQPTRAGAVLYEGAKRLLETSEGLEREVRDLAGTLSSELLIGTSDTNALYFLPPYVRAFARDFPETRLRIMCRPSAAVTEGVANGELDAGIVTLPVEHPELDVRKLFEQRFVLAVPARHPLAQRKRARLSVLRDERLVLLDPATRTGALIRESLESAGIEPALALDSGSFEVIKRYVAEGVGISILPEMAILAPDRKRIRAVAVSGLPSVTMGAVWPRGRYLTRAARQFVERLQAPQSR